MVFKLSRRSFWCSLASLPFWPFAPKARAEIGADEVLHHLVPLVPKESAENAKSSEFVFSRLAPPEYFCPVHGVTTHALTFSFEGQGEVPMCMHCVAETLVHNCGVAADLSGYKPPRVTPECLRALRERGNDKPAGGSTVLHVSGAPTLHFGP